MNACGCVYSTQYLNTFLFTLDLIVLVCLEYEWAKWQILSGCSAGELGFPPFPTSWPGTYNY